MLTALVQRTPRTYADLLALFEAAPVWKRTEGPGPAAAAPLEYAAAEAGDERRPLSAKLVELVPDSCLWHAPGGGDAFATIAIGDAGGPVATYPIRGREFRRLLAGRCFVLYKKAPGTQAMQDALAVLEAKAVFGGAEHTPAIRVGEHGGRLYLDLADDKWRAVEIDADGWRLVESCPVRFRRAKAMLPLPAPRPGGHIEELRRFVNVAPEGWPLLLGWLAAAFRPIGPYPVATLQGEQGSAKSTSARVVRAIADPNAAALRCEPQDPRDLMIAANNGWVVALDNLSSIPGWLSDALCRLSTGGGLATRTLYADDEETIFNAMRPVLVTSIEELANRSDLLDRSVILQLPRIPEERRRTETEHWREFQQAHGRILGAVLDGVAAAVRNLPKTCIERLPRMADFALWATAAETGFGLRPGDFMRAYTENRQDANQAAIESTPVARYVLDLAAAGSWSGTASELLSELNAKAKATDQAVRSWPKAARSLSAVLKRLAPNLRAAGAAVDFFHEGRGDGRRRIITIEAVGDANGEGGDATGTQTGNAKTPQNTALGTVGTMGTQNPSFDLERTRVSI